MFSDVLAGVGVKVPPTHSTRWVEIKRQLVEGGVAIPDPVPDTALKIGCAGRHHIRPNALRAEHAVTSHISGKVEYLYASLGDCLRGRANPSGMHLLRAGANYRFYRQRNNRGSAWAARVRLRYSASS